jgi:hypothetical protein
MLGESTHRAVLATELSEAWEQCNTFSEDEWGKRARLSRQVKPQGERWINLVMANRRNHPETPGLKSMLLVHGLWPSMYTFPIATGG